jgi:hypothetical protein
MSSPVQRYVWSTIAENLCDLIGLNNKFYADECSFAIKLELLLGESIVGWSSSDLNDASLDNWRASFSVERKKVYLVAYGVL